MQLEFQRRARFLESERALRRRGSELVPGGLGTRHFLAPPAPPQIYHNTTTSQHFHGLLFVL